MSDFNLGDCLFLFASHTDAHTPEPTHIGPTAEKELHYVMFFFSPSFQKNNFSFRTLTRDDFTFRLQSQGKLLDVYGECVGLFVCLLTKNDYNFVAFSSRFMLPKKRAEYKVTRVYDDFLDQPWNEAWACLLSCSLFSAEQLKQLYQISPCTFSHQLATQ